MPSWVQISIYRRINNCNFHLVNGQKSNDFSELEISPECENKLKDFYQINNDLKLLNSCNKPNINIGSNYMDNNADNNENEKVNNIKESKDKKILINKKADDIKILTLEKYMNN